MLLANITAFTKITEMKQKWKVIPEISCVEFMTIIATGTPKGRTRKHTKAFDISVCLLVLPFVVPAAEISHILF